MAISKRLETFLMENKARFRSVSHAEAFTANETAAAMHVKGKGLAKVVMVKTKKGFVMAVLPASMMVDFKKLREALGDKETRLASEQEFKSLFPDCEPGAEPPFGLLYDVETIIDKSLSDIGGGHFYFNGGNHHDSIDMAYSDYAGLVRPRVEGFARDVH